MALKPYAQPTLKIAFGTIDVAVGLSMSLASGGGAAIPGGILIGVGVDQIISGVYNLSTGQNRMSLLEYTGYSAAQFLGASDGTAGIIGAFTPAGVSLIGGIWGELANGVATSGNVLGVFTNGGIRGTASFDVRLIEGAKAIARARGMRFVEDISQLAALTNGDEVLVIVAHGNRFVVNIAGTRYSAKRLAQLLLENAPLSTQRIELIVCDCGLQPGFLGLFGRSFAQQLADLTGWDVLGALGKVDIPSTITGNPQVFGWFGNLLAIGRGWRWFLP